MKKSRKRGRPPGSRNRSTIVQEVAGQKVTINETGVKRSVTLAEALLLRLERMAMNGNTSAVKLLSKLRAKHDPEPADDAGILLAPELPTKEEWIRQAEIKNSFAEPPIMPEGKPGNATGAVGNGAELGRDRRKVEYKEPDPANQKPSMRNRLIR